MKQHNQLYPEDQARVDEYLRTGFNSVERKPFRPWIMMAMWIAVVASFSGLSLLIARLAGVQ
ncbi:MAG: DUF3094 family protein [Spongiibacteraceae bacterium]|jgi:hypothetical protein|nr:DUF3094 family protein [Spongiibacteraceae bacterium]